MNQAIQQAINSIHHADFAEYFRLMDQEVPSGKRATFNQLRGMFTSNNYPHNFDQQLITFAREVEGLLEKTPPITHDVTIKGRASSDLDAIKRQIGRNNLKEAIADLTEIAEEKGDKNLIKQVLMASASFRAINTLTMSHDEVFRKKAQISDHLFDIMDNMDI